MKDKFDFIMLEAREAIIQYLESKEKGYGYRKWQIQKHTGIPMEFLTIALRQLKENGRIQLIMIWSESTGLPDGSGYCLTGNLN